MSLGADAIVLVFHERILKITESFLCGLRRAGQHEPQRMEQPHLRVAQLACDGQLKGLAYVAQQHIRSLHLDQSSAIGLRDRLLHQAFFKPNPQIAGHDFQNVLGFQRRGLGEKLPH